MLSGWFTLHIFGSVGLVMFPVPSSEYFFAYPGPWNKQPVTLTPWIPDPGNETRKTTVFPLQIGVFGLMTLNSDVQIALVILKLFVIN